MSPDFAKVEAYLHEHIPITKAMGIKVAGYDGNAVRLWAPLEPNLNHRQTAFGGSVSALGILAGWSLLHLKLGESGESVQLVIQHSETEYTGPIDRDFTAVCAMPGPEEWARYEQVFRRYGKARVYLESLIEAEGRVLARHKGSYVAIRR
ncbi:MAG TPA: YiiD C-terminal domain-containing protein [Gammaproteobacteria bacterium]|nr:YiiD C-terminal domain-containing protein [Gammaproteobacteria bacterium]